MTKDYPPVQQAVNGDAKDRNDTAKL